MTVPSEVNRSGPYLGNGVTTVFSYGFKIVNQAHLRVIRTDAAGNETVLTLGTNYSVAGVGNAGGGSITVSPAPASGQKITILRAMPFTQNLDLENQGAYLAEDVERALDEGAMRDQQLAEELKRAVKVPPGANDPDGQLSDELAKGILTLYPISDSIKTVADNVGIVETVSDSIAVVQAVGTNIAAVVNVSSHIADIQEANSNIDVIEDVSENMPDVKNVSEHMTELLAASGSVIELKDQSYVAEEDQTEFTLPSSSVTDENVMVWVAGVRQVPGVDYSVDGTLLTMTDPVAVDTDVDVLVIGAVSVGAVNAMYSDFEKGVRQVQQVFVAQDGVREYHFDREGNPLYLTQTNHSLFGRKSPMTPLILGEDYEVKAWGVLFKFDPAPGDIYMSVGMQRATNSEAQVLMNEAADVLYDRISGDVERAEAAALDAQTASPFSFDTAEEFFLTDRTFTAGSMVKAKTGEAWLIVSPGTGDFIHPVTGQSVKSIGVGWGNTFEQFGAIGDGIVDDSDALEKAFAYVEATKHVAFILGAGKSYKTTRALVVPNGLALLGGVADEAGSTARSEIKNTTTDMFDVGSANKRSLAFFGVRFTGGSDNEWFKSKEGELVGLQWSQFSHIGINGFKNAWRGPWTGVTFDHSWVTTRLKSFAIGGADWKLTNNYINTRDWQSGAEESFVVDMLSSSKALVMGNFISGRGKMMPIRLNNSHGNRVVLNEFDADVGDAEGNKKILGCGLYLYNKSSGNIVSGNYFNGVLAAPFGVFSGAITVVDASDNLIGRNTYANILGSVGSLVAFRQVNETSVMNSIEDQIAGDVSAKAVAQLSTAGNVSFKKEVERGDRDFIGTLRASSFSGMPAASATAEMLRISVSGEANYRFVMQANGRMNFGPGSGPTDAYLQREGVNTLGFSGPVRNARYTVATLPSASLPGCSIMVTDATGGAQMAFSDGTNWRRFSDRTVIN